MTSELLTIGRAITLGSLLDACAHSYPATWLADGDGPIVSGTLRAIVKDDRGSSFMTSNTDVRDGYVWVSGTFEHFIPVRDVLDWIEAGTFALNYRA